MQCINYIILLQNFVGTMVARAPLSLNYINLTSLCRQYRHIVATSISKAARPHVRFPGLYANKYAFIVKYAFIAKYAIICIIRMMLFYLESSETPRKL
jgi:hypothetical protein